MHVPRTAACAAVLLVAGCAGDGSGLDENGRPVGEQSDVLLPELSSIQSKVFTPVCTTCHAGSSAPRGLRLEEGASYAMLVNAPSTQVPALMRVAPGNPDASYLIQKLEGTAAVGGRMPLNGPALPAETIAVIRQWIANGAPQSTNISFTQSTRPATIETQWPLPASSMHDSGGTIVLSANSALDTTLLTAGVITLVASGGDGDFTNGNERTLHPSLTIRSSEPTVLALKHAGDWLADRYELRISGGPPLALADLGSRPIDGDRDGEPGGDFVLHFTVEEVR